MEILRSIDFTKYRPLVLILEMIPIPKAASWTEKSGDSGIFAGKRLCRICLYRNQFHFY